MYKDLKLKELSKKQIGIDIMEGWIQPGDYGLAICNIKTAVFNFSLNLVVGSDKEFEKMLYNEFEIEIENRGGNIAYYVPFEADGKEWHWINIRENNWTALDYGTIVHELHHFVHGALDDLGCTYGSGGEELYAYVQGYFMEMVVRSFVELDKIKKRRKNVPWEIKHEK